MNNERGSDAFVRRGAAANGNGHFGDAFGGLPSGDQRGSWDDFENVPRFGGEQRRGKRNNRQKNQGGFGFSNEDIARLVRINGRDRRAGFSQSRNAIGRQKEAQQREQNVAAGDFELKPANQGESHQNEFGNYVLPPLNIPRSGPIFQQGPRLHCARCGRNGHEATVCYRNADGSIRNIHHKHDMRCYSCNQGGHLARDCPRNSYSTLSPISEVTLIEGGSSTSIESLPMSPISVAPEGVEENNRQRQGLHIICNLLQEAEVRREMARSHPELYEDLVNYMLARVEI